MHPCCVLNKPATGCTRLGERLIIVSPAHLAANRCKATPLSSDGEQGVVRGSVFTAIALLDISSSNIDTEEGVQYNKKGLINGSFPTYKEGKGTQANELATRWAYREDVKVGDQTLISHNDRWYLVEKFNDLDNVYQIMKRITKKEYNRIVEDIKKYGRSGRIRSIQRGTTEISQLDKRRDSVARTQSSSNSVPSRQSRQDSGVQQLDNSASKRGQTASDRNGDSKGSSTSEQEHRQ